MTRLPQPTDTGATDAARNDRGKAGISRAVSGVTTAIIATVLAVGIWAQGLGAIWAFLKVGAPLLAEHWSIALIVLLVGRVLLNFVRPGPVVSSETFLRTWTSSMLLLAGVGIVVAPEENDPGASPVEPGRFEIELVQAYGPGPYTPAGANQPGALSLITYLARFENVGSSPIRAETVSVFIPSSRDGGEYSCAYPRGWGGLTLEEGDSLSVYFGRNWLVQNRWSGEPLPPGYYRDFLLLCVVDDSAERSAFTANQANHRLVVVDSNERTASASETWSTLRRTALSGSRFEALADRVER